MKQKKNDETTSSWKNTKQYKQKKKAEEGLKLSTDVINNIINVVPNMKIVD
jgi:hypothetical protein